mmetsp:Transcript_3884/g.5926  ORF Transcript_3884/g.5926 Transcript_3884/m.5926 type:complete len:203 (-) Transcript_3884:305-913(-)
MRFWIPNWLLVMTAFLFQRSMPFTATTRRISKRNPKLFSTMRTDFPRAAVAVVVHSPLSNSYALVKRGNEPNKGLWSLPGGKIEPGETTLDGAQRELQEECQLQPSSLDWYSDGAFCVTDSIHKDSNTGDIQFHYMIAQCYARAQSELPLTPSDDAADAKWITIPEIEQYLIRGETTQGVLNVLRKAEAFSLRGLFTDELSK